MKKLINNLELQQVLKDHFEWFTEDTHAFIETYPEYKTFAYGYLLCYYQNSPELLDESLAALLQDGGLLDKWEKEYTND